MDTNTLPELILTTLPTLMHRLFTPCGYKHKTTHPKGLNPTQMKTLTLLLMKGPCSLSDLGEAVNRERGSFTTTVQALEKQDLAQRKRCESDKRSWLLHLTPRGREIAEEHRNRLYQRFNQRLAELTPTERERFYNALSEINQLTEKINP